MFLRHEADVVSTTSILVSKNRPLTSRTILIASSVPLELSAELERYGARVLTWPKPAIRAPDNFAAIDDAIESLFGYDWLVFSNVNAVNFFLRRFQLEHEISELDALRVCAVGQETVRILEESRVHIDVIPDRFFTQSIVEAIDAYVGGREALRGLNFLIPSATASCSLQESLEDAGARADSVITYRTCSTNDPQRINALITGGGIDCIAFTNASEVRALGELFDTNELGRVLVGLAVACLDHDTAEGAAALGLSASIIPDNRAALAQAIAFYFRVMS
jgi:uroporphyrinogen III methyltransferase/synthase